MLTVFITALCVGGATMLGGVIGYFIRYQNPKIDGFVFSFAAGVMLAASFAELVLPAVENADAGLFCICLAGILGGGVLIHALQKLLQVLHKRGGRTALSSPVAGDGNALGALLFVAAVAIHNLPEGIAAGVAAGSDDIRKAIPVVAGIALQNLPEGMIVLPPLVHVGVSRRKALLVAVLTGVIEIVGTFFGYLLVAAAARAYPLILCIAGGTMLCIICTDVLEDANRMAGKRLSGYAFLIGCCMMLIMGRYL